MRKRLFISAVSLLLTVVCYAQWSVQDSLKLQKLLESSEELNSAVRWVLPGCRRRKAGCCLTNRFPKHCLNQR